MTLYTKNPKESIEKLLESIPKLSNVAGYEMNILKVYRISITGNKQSENEIKKPIPFIISSKRITYLEINLTKEL